ncbi:MAG TPA: glycosyltransferase [Dehalococcoidia bacterium]|nr:glycosyltransferase [Dehalococcoidia bacterium]
MTQRLRLCYVADAGSPHVQKWAGHFALEHDVHVVSFRPGSIPRARVHVLADLPALSKARYPLEAPRLRALLEHIEPDLVHALHVTSYGFVAALARARPLVVSAWGYDILQAPRRTPLHAWMTRFALSQAQAITATGEALATATRRFAPAGRAVHVVPYGIDLDRFAPADDDRGKSTDEASAPIIGSVKALLPTKGFPYLIKAMPLILERHPNARLVLIGEGPERPRLDRLIASLRLENHVELPGELPNSEVPDQLRCMDVYVQPSLTESFGVSALEASACGLPVVATDVEGGRDIVRHGETGLLVPPGDARALASAILRLLDDPALAKRMGEAGRRFVRERYNWPDNAARMAAIYNETVEAWRARHR